MNSSRIALIAIAILALVLWCVPTRTEAIQCKIDVVFLLDVSSSMDDEIGALCTKIKSVAGLLTEHNVVTRYEILALYDGRTSCSEKTTMTQFGDEKDGARSIEDWGRGVSVVSAKYDWQEDGVKVVVPISDEGPFEGDPVDQKDEYAIEQAVGWAKDKGVIVSPIVGTGASQDVIRLAEKIAGATEGKAFRSIQPNEDMFDGIFEQIQQACLTQQVQVPDVIGLRREYAAARLREAGLPLRRVRYQSSSQPLGTIVVQNPPAGTTVKVDTPVDVVLAQRVEAPVVSELISRTSHPAAPLQENYKKLQVERRSLERQWREDFESRQKKLEEDLKKTENRFQECDNPRWQVFWEESGTRPKAEHLRRNLEKGRRKLEGLRKELDEERRDLDNRRARLESTYTNRNPGSPYEVQFREYMQQLTSSYFPRLRNELFKGFDEYDNGAEGYMQLFNEISDVCEKEYSRVAQYTDNAVKATDRAIKKISGAVNGILKIVGFTT